MSDKSSERLHSLDGLRAIMMVLGIILHGIIAYTTKSHGSSWPLAYGLHSANTAWPYHDPKGFYFFDLVYDFIHIFRMPLFFLLSGFFSHLISIKKGNEALVKSRIQRILYPLLVFWPLVFPLVGAGMMVLMGGFETGLPKQNEFVVEGNLIAILSPIHLWFLYYLLYFYAAILAVQFILKKFPKFYCTVNRLFLLAFLSSWSVFIFAIPLGLLLNLNGGWVTSASNFIPDFSAMLIFFSFFLFGWFLYTIKNEMDRFKNQTLWHLALACVLTLYLVNLTSLEGTEMILTASFGASLAVWCFIFSLTGLFMKYFSRPDKRLTYLAKSSYWLYLIHLPVIIWAVIALKGFDIPGQVKAVLVLAISFTTLILSYEFAVKRTFIGRFLNGR